MKISVFNKKLHKKKRVALNLMFFLSVCIFIAGHAIYINTPWVNLEYSFAEAARGILDSGYTIGFEKYWEVEANPLGYSLITAVIASFWDISFWSIRIPSLLGGIAILIAGWLFYRSRDFENNSLFFLWTAIISINPLVWIYSGRATADILPVGLIALAFFLCYCAEERLWIHLIAGFCFSLASLVKFNSLLLGLGFVYILFTNREGKITWNWERGVAFLFYSILPACVLGIYFFVIYDKFGIVFIPENFKTSHFEGYVKDFLSNLFMYGSYLTTLLALVSVLSVIHIWNVLSQKQFLIIVTVALTSGIVVWEILSHFNAGEMGYSYLYDTVLNKKIISLIRVSCFVLSFFLFVEVIITAFRERSRIAFFLLCTILPFLIISSFSKPAQRYLLFCLPFLTFYLIVILGSRMIRLTHWLGWSSVVIFVMINFISIFYQVGQGRASENMAQWVISHGYLKDTEPGAIKPHTGHHFFQASDERKRYIINIKKTPPENFLHKESITLFGNNFRTYYLIEQNSQ